MKKLFIFALAAIGLLACNGKNDPKDPSNDSATITCDPTTKTVDGFEGGEFTVTITSNAAWSATANKSWVTVTPNSGQGDAFATVTVTDGNNDEARVLFSNGNSTATLIINREVQAYPGMLPGMFSISASKQVHFSQGNLQYQASTDTWRFANEQYYVIGNDNSNISSSYSGWIDLFGWGTGNSPTNYSSYVTSYPTFFEWGVNAISNGGNEANLWRTLTKDEWVHLFYYRKNASTLFGLGRISGINGLIILPDNWTTPQGASFTPSSSKGLKDDGGRYYHYNGNHFSDNTYTVEQWSVMESAGAVFLPAAGYREVKTVNRVGSYGYYWSCMPSSTDDAYYLYFYSEIISPKGDGFRREGYSVRLVR